MATDCAARGGSTGLHSGLRTGRIAGLLRRPWAGRHVHGCRVVGAVPGRQRRGEFAAVGRTRRGPADPPRSGVRAGARTASQVKFAVRASGRRCSAAGPGLGLVRVSASMGQPALKPGPRGHVSHTAGGVLTGPRPAPAAAPGHEDRARATQTTPPPEPRAGRCGRSEPALRAAGPGVGGLAPSKGPLPNP